MDTKVVNIRIEPFDVYIGRAGHGRDGYFGNPIKLSAGSAKGSTLIEYTDYFLKRLGNDSEFKDRVLALKGKTLGCFCKPGPCHGDVIARYLDSQTGSRL